MLKQIFEIKGMMRDLDPAKLNSNYAYEIRNLRLTAQEDSTMLSLVSEKGNAKYNIINSNGDPFTIEGDIIGYCTLHDYIVLFTHTNIAEPEEPEEPEEPSVPYDPEESQKSAPIDKIYRLEMNGMNMIAVELYHGNFGFGDDGVDIESIGVYENKDIQKVYWIDGVHQPRYINIVEKDTSKWNDNSFDFVPLISRDEDVVIEKTTFNGMFNAGTIQYFLTYYNRNGRQSAVFYQSPLNYISHADRGASVEDTVNNSFNIRIYNPDKNFDYIRVYSVFRSAENGVPVCKKVRDIRTKNSSEEEREFIEFTGVSIGSETTYDGAEDILLSYWNFYIVDSNNKVIDMDNFLQYKEGDSYWYRINSNYSLFEEYRQDHHINKKQAVDGEAIIMKIYSNKFSIYKSGESSIRLWNNIIAEKSNYSKTYKYIECIDNGISNEVVDYGEILFAGGSNIIPSTMAVKDNTLFFGNYKNTLKISEDDKDIIKNNTSIHFGYSSEGVYKGDVGTHYMYHNQFDEDAKKITTFKGGETYYFGIILQDSHGMWTDVIPVGATEGTKNNYYPNDNDYTHFYPIKAFIHFDQEALDIINNYTAVKVVRLDTLPTVVAQGVLCPTVFNKYRDINSPYCMSSWFFRDIKPGDDVELTPHHIQNLHNGNIIDGLKQFDSDSIRCIGEIQGSSNSQFGYYDYDINYDNINDTDMFIDWNTLTLNSPDLEFGQIQNSDYKMRIIGITPITSGITSMSLTWSTAISNIQNDIFKYDKIKHYNVDVNAYEIELNNFLVVGQEELNERYKYPVYPWHRNGSLITLDDEPQEDDVQQGLLETKVMASLRESISSRYLVGPSYDITKIKIYNDDSSLLLLDEDKYNPFFNDKKVYAGDRDVVLTNITQYYTYREYGNNIQRCISASEPVRMQYRSSTHGVFSLKSTNDFGNNHIDILPNVGIGGELLADSDNNVINYKFAGTIKFILNVPSEATISINAQKVIKMTSSDGIDYNMIIPQLNRDDDSNDDDLSFTLTINNLEGYSGVFLGNDIIILSGTESYNNIPFRVISYNADNRRLVLTTLNDDYYGNEDSYSTIRKEFTKIFLSEDNLTCEINGITQYYNIEYYNIYFILFGDNTYSYYRSKLYCIKDWYTSDENDKFHYMETGPCELVYELDKDKIYIHQEEYDVSNINISINNKSCSYMYLAELYSENNTTPNYENASWVVASEPVKTGKQCVEASIGDTYYQRYDCLKTYPQSLENQNSIVEIFSFMCETKINIDGRYDNRRGLPDNTAIIGSNFNSINKAYTQTDNIFAYHYLDPDSIYVNDFPNQIIYTMTKVFGSDIDSWTQVVATSTLDMDGSLGKIRSLKLWNDNLLCFQDMGIAKIMYNERTALSTELGIPIEIANSNKLEGKKYITNQIGCSNKNSIQATQNGLYFIDSNTKDIYAWRDNLKSLSKDKGFNTYMQKDISCINSEKTFYDPQFQDLYFRFTDDDKTECLVFNEQLNEFTSFFDYDIDIMFPFKDSLISVKNNDNSLWKQFAGEYLRYFDEEEDGHPVYKDYIIQLISAEHPTLTKTFTNVEFRADVLNGSITEPETQAFSFLQGMNICPFNTLKAWNEYQNTGDEELTKLLRKGSNMSQKFRIWRADIGRDKAKGSRIFSRIISPWARIKLVGGKYNMKSVIHDIAVCYV